MKYYVIKNGVKTGIFNSWDECKEYVSGYKGAVYKSFNNYQDAYNYLHDIKEVYDIPTCYIDGSYDKKTKRYSFGGVLIIDNTIKQFYKSYDEDELSKYHNVAGEIKGAAYILNYCYKNNITKLRLCYDYEGIEKWYNNKWEAKSEIAILYTNFIFKIKDKVEVEFVKIKSHTGNKYNELADQLAKKALEG